MMYHHKIQRGACVVLRGAGWGSVYQDIAVAHTFTWHSRTYVRTDRHSTAAVLLPSAGAHSRGSDAPHANRWRRPTEELAQNQALAGRILHEKAGNEAGATSRHGMVDEDEPTDCPAVWLVGLASWLPCVVLFFGMNAVPVYFSSVFVCVHSALAFHTPHTYTPVFHCCVCV